MPGFLGLIGKFKRDSFQLNSLFETLDPLGIPRARAIADEAGVFASSSLSVTPLKGERFFQNEGWVILFSGDLVDYQSIPYQEIIHNLENGHFNFFKQFNGIFAIAAFARKAGKLYLISDRRSQHPLYYFIDDNGIYFSTEIATFCRLNKKHRFNEKWLWEYLYFNFPTGSTTPLKDVFRMTWASLLEFEVNTSRYRTIEYAEQFRKREPLIKRKKALDLAVEVFSERIPKYFEGSDQIACALTGGWDGRTMTALAPPGKNITTYTYGVPGCSDLRGSTRTARRTNAVHETIEFNKAFVKELPRHMFETVFLSGGLERILRGTLSYVYKHLSAFPLTISGISLDMQLRGIGSLFLISRDLGHLFRGGSKDTRKPFWSKVVSADFSLFNEYIMNSLKWLEDKFGNFSTTNHHLSYILYVLSTRHFCGELQLASNFTTVRVPSWDSHIVDLCFSIKNSMLSFSEYSDHVPGGRDEVVLQAYLLKNLNPKFAKISIGNTRPDIVLKGESAYQAYWYYSALKNRLTNLRAWFCKIPLEDWSTWLKSQNTFIDSLLFADNTQITQYVKKEFLDHLKKNPDIHYLGKLATIEIIIRLIKNGWYRFW